MNTERRRILVVSESLVLANNLLVWLREAGYDPAVVTTFNAGKEYLRTAPDILITELKLREYNGIHLALRAHRNGIPTAIIGGSDPGFAEDAQEVGARYVDRDSMDRDDIILLVDGLLSARRSRKADRIDWNLDRDNPPAEPMLTVEDDWDVDSPTGHRGAARISQGRPVVH